MDRLRAMDVKFLKGVGPKRAELLASELDIHTCYDLLCYYPSHYVDRSRYYTISSFSHEMPSVQVKGRFVRFSMHGEGAKTRLVGLFSDGTGTMEVVWFKRLKWIKDAYRTDLDYVLFGKPMEFSGRWSMVHPEIEDPYTAESSVGLRGVYSLTEKLRNRGITSRTLHQLIQGLLRAYATEIHDPLPPDLVRGMHMMTKYDALLTVHNPPDNDRLVRARNRLKFEELLMLQLNILNYARRRSLSILGHRFTQVGHYFNTFYRDCMPFELTGAQKRVIKEVRADMNTGRQMNRLLQGDVGSGKTLVALMCMLIALDNGTQACLMAPTEILATQHYETIAAMVAPIGINVKLLTGSTPKKQRDVIHSQLLDGSLHILIGTHAVIEDVVRFRNLGFVVIDEQHRFGVAQRGRMWKKNTLPPHILVMTATPIPRTLAMTVYGDLDVSVIDELPPGRKPVVTLLRYENHRMDVYQAMARQLREGRQVYVVFPLIRENENVDMKSLEEGYEQICEVFRDWRVAYVHGQMKPAEKDAQMNLFASHEADILVATTVIEVGVNVPNATTMIIENAERFGLSQLHQLRGRVGRGEGQSYCVLMTKSKISTETRSRLEIMTSTTDGFVVAEADLKMRGPGDLEGTMQSGMPIELRIASLTSDGRIIKLARDVAQSILDADPDLSMPQHVLLRKEMEALFAKAADWGMIS